MRKKMTSQNLVHQRLESMELEKQVVSLDLALALRDAGYPQENALFYWRSPLPHYGYNEWSLGDCQMAHGADNVAAPLASELGEVLKEHARMPWWVLTQQVWRAEYKETKIDEAKTEADARARLFLHLRKASLI